MQQLKPECFAAAVKRYDAEIGRCEKLSIGHGPASGESKEQRRREKRCSQLLCARMRVDGEGSAAAAQNESVRVERQANAREAMHFMQPHSTRSTPLWTRREVIEVAAAWQEGVKGAVNGGNK